MSTRNARALPVDRGWAWVVLLGGVISGILVSVGYVVGLFNVVFLEVFGKDKFTTTWIGSLASSLPFVSGPLATYLSGKIGPRPTVAAGAAIGSLGFVLASLSRSFIQLFLCYGLVTGIGVGMCTLPCVIAIGNHFHTYRNLAYGIYNSSVGLGTVFFPPLVTVCMQHYGWRGAMLILGGCCLNFLLAAATLRPFDRKIIDGDDGGDTDKSRHDSGHHSLDASDGVSPLAPAEKHKDPAKSPAHRQRGGGASYAGSVRLEKSLFSLDIVSQSAIGFGSLTTVRSATRHRASRGGAEGRAQGGSRIFLPDMRKHESADDIHDKGQLCLEPGRFSQSHGLLPQAGRRLPDSPFVPRLFRKPHDVEGDSIMSLSNQSLASGSGAAGSRHSQQYMVKRDIQFFDSQLMEEEARGSWRGMWNPGLVGLCASQFLYSAGMSITYLHLPAYAMSHGSSALQSSSLISVIGITNVSCRFLVGAATSLSWVDDGLIYMGTSLVAGVCLCLADPMISRYATQLLFAGLFGFFANGYVSLMGPLTIKYVGLEHLGPAYSMQVMLAGIAFFVGPPLAGLLFDITGSFEYSFYAAGISYIVGSMVMVPAWVWARKRGAEGQSAAAGEGMAEEEGIA